MAVGHGQVEVPVLVEIRQDHPPPRGRHRVHGQARLAGPVLEEDRAVGTPVPPPERGVLAEEVGDDHVLEPVAVVVAACHPHVGLDLPLPVDGDPPGRGHVLERAVMPVAPEGIGLGVVGHEDVDPAVAVEVRGQAAHAAALRRRRPPVP